MKIYKIPINLLIFAMTTWSFAQDLTILSGEPFVVSNNTNFYTNGLAILPSSDFNIVGPNAISRSSSAIDVQSINRVFTWDNTLSGFQGTMTFFYEDTELNSLTENDLLLKVKDAFDIWNEYPASLDTSANTLAFTFGTAIDFSSVTAGETASLSISDFDLKDIILYPNPTISKVYINADFNFEVTVYNLMGQFILKSNQKTVDLSSLNSGSYIFNIKDLFSESSKSFKIIKN